MPGTIDHLVDELKDTYNRSLPAADLLLSNSYEALMMDVVDIKDLGSGVINGVECDFLAFRNKDVDWQIWIAQGDRPYQEGMVGFNTVISTLKSLLSQQNQLVSTQGAVAGNLVDVYKSLGGGWEIRQSKDPQAFIPAETKTMMQERTDAWKGVLSQ